MANNTQMIECDKILQKEDKRVEIIELLSDLIIKGWNVIIEWLEKKVAVYFDGFFI